MKILEEFKPNESVKVKIEELDSANLNFHVKARTKFIKPKMMQVLDFEGDLLNVKTENHEYSVTPDHPSLIQGNNEVRSDQLKVGDILLTVKGLESITDIKKEPYNGKVYDFTIPEEESFYANDILTHNCRLRLDLRELSRKGGGLFGAYDSTGSIGVVTINLPRLGYLTRKENNLTTRDLKDLEKVEKLLYVRLDHLLDLAYRSLEIKRKVITKLLDEGFYPYTKAYLGTFANHFSTIGIVGMNEMLENLLGVNIASGVGQEFSVKVLEHIRSKLSDFQEDSGNLFNLEETPAESTCYRLAKHDLAKYADIIHQGTSLSPYYTNSSHLPVDYTSDLWDTLDHQAKMQSYYTGGTAMHIFLDDGIDGWERTRDLVKKACSTSKVPYISITPTYSICPVHGYLKGHMVRCPICRDEQIAAYKAKLVELEKEKDQ